MKKKDGAYVVRRALQVIAQDPVLPDRLAIYWEGVYFALALNWVVVALATLGVGLDSCYLDRVLCIAEVRLVVGSNPGCFVSRLDGRSVLWQRQMPSVAVYHWSLCPEAAAVVMRAPLSLEGKDPSRSSLVRMDPLGDFAAMAMAAQMTVETRVYYCSDNTAEVSHRLLGQARGGWM